MRSTLTRSSAASPEVDTPDLDTDLDIEIETEEEHREELAPMYRVICHDDPVTTMDFVVDVFRSVFRLPRARALEVMLRVHNAGAAVVGRYPEESARRRVERATRLARAGGFPLTFTIERDD